MTKVSLIILGYAFLASSCVAKEGDQNKDLHRLFVYNDNNHDGCLSIKEWQRMAEKTLALRGKRPYSSDAEVASYLEAFSKLDLNRDGCLNEAEYATSLLS